MVVMTGGTIVTSNDDYDSGDDMMTMMMMRSNWQAETMMTMTMVLT